MQLNVPIVRADVTHLDVLFITDHFKSGKLEIGLIQRSLDGSHLTGSVIVDNNGGTGFNENMEPTSIVEANLYDTAIAALESTNGRQKIVTAAIGRGLLPPGTA